MKMFQYVWVASAAVLLVNSSLGQLLPDLVPTAIQAPASITGPPNMPLRVAWNVSNQGNGPALGGWTDILFLSASPWLDAFSAYLGDSGGQTPLEPGESYWNTNRVTLRVGESGNYFLILSVDHYNWVEESATENNQMAFPFTFTATPADLTPVALIVPSSFSGPPKPYVPVVWGVTNQGTGSAYGQWNDVVYFSTNSSLDPSATQILFNSESGSVPVSSTYWRTNNLRLPVTQGGTYYLFFRTDSDNSLHEADTNNNVTVASITVNVQPPDLAALDLQVPAAVAGAPNPSLTVVYGVTNISAVTVLGDPYWYDAIYLSEDPLLDPNDRIVLQQYEWQTVPPGGSYSRTATFNVPVVTNGSWYLILKADSFDSLGDPTPDDTVSVPVTFTILPPDLVPLAQAPAEVNGPPYPYVTIAFGSTNQGIGAAQPAWSDYVYFSTTPSLDSASALTSSARYDPLPPGGAYWQTSSVRLPVRSMVFAVRIRPEQQHRGLANHGAHPAARPGAGRVPTSGRCHLAAKSGNYFRVGRDEPGRRASHWQLGLDRRDLPFNQLGLGWFGDLSEVLMGAWAHSAWRGLLADKHPPAAHRDEWHLLFLFAD
jgi:CARDB